MLHWICTEQPEPEFEGHYMPRRALSPGMHAGLSVIMDVQEREYYCSATESVGFKVDTETVMFYHLKFRIMKTFYSRDYSTCPFHSLRW